MFAATFLSYQGRFNSFSDYYLWERLVALKRTRMLCWTRNRLGALSPNTSGQLDILRHDRDTFGMNGAQVSVFKKTDEICLCCLLQCQDCPTGKVEPAFKVLGNLPYQSLKGKPPYQKFSRLLKLTNLTKGHSTRPIPVWLFGCRWLLCTPLLWWLSPPQQLLVHLQPGGVRGHRHLQVLPFMIRANF